ncbi:restriction endonuclease subunit S [Ensifer sp. ENS10]|uniref:restriction endonuclease subunit S n=1 Tax=Ensifer sp. ENS10 TaxID=2769286 RepID=UPI00177ACB9E|nr:restriction endonuclease subunit S [Ensifer sp. ENS10]MBD9509917.1 restriction endonuclease subunit S [Ensifer sp. ENS10]
MGYLVTNFANAPFEIIDGDRGKAYPKQSDFRDSGYCLFLSATNVTKSGFDFSTGQFVDEQKDAQLRKGKLQRHDVVLTTRGTLGNVAHYDDSVSYENVRINSGMVILRCDRSKILPSYLYAFLRSDAFKLQVGQMRSGVAQPQLPIRDMSRIELPLPPLHQQKRLEEIISGYDDLIGNNLRRIALLEQAARMLYREWFVHFRFPGHEHTKFIGGLPEGWKQRTLGDVADTNRESYQAKGLPDEITYIDISSVSQGRIISKTRMSSNDAPGRARRKAKSGDIIWSNVRPNLRAFALVLEPSDIDVISTGFTVLSAREVPFTWLYVSVTTDQFVGHLVNHATGAGYPAVRPDDFERAIVVVPPKALLAHFHESTEPNFQLISKLEQQNRKLVQARDLLLPRLMNGEIAV